MDQTTRFNARIKGFERISTEPIGKGVMCVRTRYVFAIAVLCAVVADGVVFGIVKHESEPVTTTIARVHLQTGVTKSGTTKAKHPKHQQKNTGSTGNQSVGAKPNSNTKSGTNTNTQPSTVVNPTVTVSVLAPPTGTATPNTTSTLPPNNTVNDSLSASEFSTAEINGMSFLTPQNWNKTPISGGDYTGYRFVNPSDNNEVITAIISQCSGCVTNGSDLANGETNVPDPSQLLTASDTNPVIGNNGLSVQYTINSSPYAGVGEILVEQQNNQIEGYERVEVFFPASYLSLADNILNSLQF